MKKTVFLLMILTIVAKIIGFAREIALSYFFGASYISDAYLISQTIPAVLFGFVGAALSTSYIPIYSDVMRKKGTEPAIAFTNNVTNVFVAISTFIVIAVIAFTEPVVKLFASGFEGETLNLAISFTRVSVLGIYFTAIGYIYRSYLQLKDRFILPTVLGFVSNFIIITSIMLSARSNVMILAIGSVLAAASQAIFLLPSLYKRGYRYSFIFDIKDNHLIKMMHQALPVIIGNSANQINWLVDRTIASRIVVGGISALYYANKLNGFVQGIFVASIATVMYPLISKMAAEGDMEGIKSSLKESITGSNLLVVPATVASMIFAGPVVQLLFGRGAFDAQAAHLTSYALFFYAVGMTGFGLREVLARVFYSLQDTRTPMINAFISMVLNIILNIILSKFLGIGGLALATSIAALFCTVLLFISLRKKIGPFGMKEISISFIKILFSSLIMGLIAKYAYNILQNNMDYKLSLFISMGIGALVYFVAIYFMKIEDVEIIISAIRRKMKKRA
ncbi:MAG: murein biosynthesis integral membrane protein MurJ [Lutispora sp.]|nr:murein biosynthesis integral membrane protein MurJ [Lutispora sp.]MDD4833811.1 murein biosynthesis integral membrane protein MurJ [Lutispora sp.]